MNARSPMSRIDIKEHVMPNRCIVNASTVGKSLQSRTTLGKASLGTDTWESIICV